MIHSPILEFFNFDFLDKCIFVFAYIYLDLDIEICLTL